MTFLKHKNKIAILLSVFMILSAVLGMCLFNTPSANAATAEITTTDAIMTNYVMGDTFTVPDVTISYGGKDYAATNGVLVKPDGNAYAKGTYTLDQLGKYTVKYSVTSDADKTIYAEKTFNVERSIYDVTSTLSSFEWVDEIPRYEGLEDNKYTPWAGDGKPVVDEDGKPVYVQEVDGDGNPVVDEDGKPVYVQQTRKYMPSGLTVTLTEGEFFTIYKPFNLSEIGISELLHFYTPQTINNYIAEDIVLRITDCYDESNYIEILVEFSGYAEFRSNPAGAQDAYMFKPSESQLGRFTETYIDGVLYSCRYGAYGPIIDSKAGRVRDIMMGYDASTGYTKYLNASDEWGTVVDTMNEAFFGKNAFKGFTTNEVFLSVYGKNYAEAKPFEMSIMEIAGLSGDELKLSSYHDTVKPVIEVDYEATDENGVYVVKGEEFEIFPAKAFDVNLLGEVSSSVYYCGSNYDVNVAVKDGKFTPDKLGTYKIVYKATDSFGNVGEETCYLTCIETQNGKSVMLETGGEITNAKAGVDTEIPMAEVVGINGNETLTITLIKPDGAKQTVKPGEKVIFASAGEYELVYAYGDKYNAYEYSYKFNVSSSDVIRFVDKPVLPRHFIANTSYSIDPLYAYDYTGADVSMHEATAYIKFDDGEYQKIDIDSFEISADATKATIKYEYGDISYEIPESIPVINTGLGVRGALDMTKYFVGDYSTVKSGSNFVFIPDTDYGKDTISYIGKTLIDDFSFTFEIPNAYSSYDALDIILTDYYDRDKQTIITFRQQSGAMFFDVNGKGAYSLRNTWASDTGKVTVAYNPDTNILSVQNVEGKNNNVIEVEFEHGFTTGYALLDLELEGINGTAGVKIRQLLNQNIGTSTSESMSPVISYENDVMNAKQGDVFTINVGYVADVITPVLKGDFKLVVSDPNGFPAVSVDGITLNGTQSTDRTYDIVFDQVGTYVIRFTAADQNGNKKGSASVNIDVVGDTEGPSVVLAVKGDSTSINLGGSHTIKATISDNSTENILIAAYAAIQYKGSYVYFVKLKYDADSGKWSTGSYKPNFRGVYTVYVQAYDEVGNITTVSYVLNVK